MLERFQKERRLCALRIEMLPAAAVNYLETTFFRTASLMQR
jgi:hypothetical protein